MLLVYAYHDNLIFFLPFHTHTHRAREREREALHKIPPKGVYDKDLIGPFMDYMYFG